MLHFMRHIYISLIDRDHTVSPESISYDKYSRIEALTETRYGVSDN